MTRPKLLKEFVPGRGYTKEDWDDADSPPITEEEAAGFRPLREADPELYATIMRNKEARKISKPRKPPPKVRVSLRVDSDTLEAFKATGKGWQTRMNDALKRAAPKAA
jgi:uncharacterized protein (DUF4415 family)